MKSTDFSLLLKRSADLMESAGASRHALALDGMARVFAAGREKSVSNFVESLRSIDFPKGTLRQTTLSGVEPMMTALVSLLSTVASKGACSDLALVSTFLKQHADVSIDALVDHASNLMSTANTKQTKSAKQLRSDIVDLYNKRLEEALGDEDGFRNVYQQLGKDSNVGPAELAALAKRFAFASTRGRDQSLRKIMARHQSLLTARAASRATAGRVAG